MPTHRISALFLLSVLSSSGAIPATVPIDIGSRLELFVDHHLIDRLDRATLKLHSPVIKEVAFYEDAPWEGNYGGYHSIVRDGDQFRYYYRGTQRLDDGINKFAHMVTCCIVSRDGITWERPSFGLIEFQGSTDNNIIWKNEDADGFRGYSSCFMVSLNANPDARPEERYIALAVSERAATGADGKPICRHVILTSPDGVKFTMKPEPIIERSRGDAGGDVIFWDTNLRQYVVYTRVYRNTTTGALTGYGQGGVRQVLRSRSPDLVSWSQPELVGFGNSPVEDIYTMMPEQYFRAPHLYVGLGTRFMEKRKAVPEFWRAGINDGVLVSSRDGLKWDRTFMEAFVRPGRDRENWTSRAVYLTKGVVQTGPDEMSVYWFEHADHGPKEMRVRRGVLRLDGFASVYGPYSGGEMTTKAIVFKGNHLVVNYATSAAGSLQVEIQDEQGAPLPGYALAESPEIYGDEIERVVRWKTKPGVGELTGRPVRLRFVLKDADLYALRFKDLPD
jgi:hypothetical protein